MLTAAVDRLLLLFHTQKTPLRTYYLGNHEPCAAVPFHKTPSLREVISR